MVRRFHHLGQRPVFRVLLPAGDHLPHLGGGADLEVPHHRALPHDPTLGPLRPVGWGHAVTLIPRGMIENMMRICYMVVLLLRCKTGGVFRRVCPMLRLHRRSPHRLVADEGKAPEP